MANDSVTCPRCGTIHGDLWDLNLDDGESDEIECDCGVDLVIRCRIDIEYELVEQETGDA